MTTEGAAAAGLPEAGGSTLQLQPRARHSAMQAAAQPMRETVHFIKITPLKGLKQYTEKKAGTSLISQFNYNTKQPCFPLQENTAAGYSFMTAVQEADLAFSASSIRLSWFRNASRKGRETIKVNTSAMGWQVSTPTSPSVRGRMRMSGMKNTP